MALVPSSSKGSSGATGPAGGDLAGTYPNPTVGNVSELTTKGDLLAGAGSSVASRLAVGSNTQVLTADSTQTLGVKWAAASAAISGVTVTGTAAAGMVPEASSSSAGAWAVLPGALLAAVQYAPVSLATYTVTNHSGLTAIDTTNLTASFTVPASGNVLVRFSSSMKIPTSADLGFGLLNHSGGAQIGYTLSNVLQTSATTVGLFRLTCEWYLTGLSPGALGIDIAGGVSTAITADVYAMGATGAVNDSNVGPALIVVTAA